MQNRPFKVEDPTTGEPIVIWQSRSCAVVGIVFVKNKLDGKWYVLANQRGEGTPDFQGYWNCPCGYLDYNEDAQTAIHREVFEETGLVIDADKFIHFDTNSDPKTANRQNVTIKHYAILPGDITKWCEFSTDNMEKNEVANIKWICIGDVNDYKWAFGHKDIILNVFNTYVNISWYKKLVKNIYEKMFVKP